MTISFDFNQTPTVGDTKTIGGKTWQWNGKGWVPTTNLTTLLAGKQDLLSSGTSVNVNNVTAAGSFIVNGSYLSSPGSGILTVGLTAGASDGQVSAARYRVSSDSAALTDYSGASGLLMNSAAGMTWSSNFFWHGTKDLGIGRNAAGVLEINNGTAGTTRDLRARRVLLDAADYVSWGYGTKLQEYGNGALIITDSSGGNGVLVADRLRAGSVASYVELSKFDATTIQVNDGTGVLRDLKVRNFSASGTITGSNLSGTNTGDQDLSGLTVSSTLAAASGSSLVGYTLGATGSVTQSVQSKLRETISVKDFGAVGDGVANDYAAIIAALTAAPNGSIVFFPPGTYCTNQEILKPYGKILHIRGAGYASIIKATATIVGGGVLKIDERNGTDASPLWANRGTSIRDLVLDANFKADYALNQIAAAKLELQDIWLQNGNQWEWNGGSGDPTIPCGETYAVNVRAYKNLNNNSLNKLRNSAPATGGAVGSWPTNWTAVTSGTATASVVGYGAAATWANYVDVRITSGAAAETVTIYFEANNYVAGVQGDRWTPYLTHYLQSSTTGSVTSTQLSFEEYTSAGASLRQAAGVPLIYSWRGNQSQIPVNTTTLLSQEVTSTDFVQSATAAYVRPFVKYSVAANTDITIRICNPMIGKSSGVGPYNVYFQNGFSDNQIESLNMSNASVANLRQDGSGQNYIKAAHAYGFPYMLVPLVNFHINGAMSMSNAHADTAAVAGYYVAGWDEQFDNCHSQLTPRGFLILNSVGDTSIVGGTQLNAAAGSKAMFGTVDQYWNVTPTSFDSTKATLVMVPGNANFMDPTTATYSAPVRLSAGSVSAPSLSNVNSNNTGIYFPTNTIVGIAASGALVAKFTPSTTPVNYVAFNSGDTGVAPAISAAGEANASLWVASSGTGNLRLATGGGEQVRIVNTASSVNALTFTGGASGSNTVTIATAGGDTDRSINLVPAGAGMVKANGVQVVDLSSTQTLTNKTLTSPTINAGTFSGTIAGTPTFSGVVTLSSTPLLNSGATINANANNLTLTGSTANVNFKTADGTARFNIYYNSNGTAAPTYSVAGEDAGNIRVGITGNGGGAYFNFQSASGGGKLAGDPIAWTSLLYADLNSFQYKGDSVSTLNAAQSLSNKTLVWPVVTGSLTLTGGTFSNANNPVINTTATWNDSAAGTVSFTGIRLNVTDTLSASSSLLMDLQKGGTSQFKVDKNGNITALGTLSVGGTILSSSAGSNQIGYIQSYAGSVSRTVQARLRETISVKDFGATGDGVTDDTLAIQAALNALSGTGKDLFFPAGTYICSQLVWNDNVGIRGESPGTTTIKLKAATNDHLLVHWTWANDKTWVNIYQAMRDITLDGNNANNTAGDCLVVRSYRFKMDNCVIQNAAGNGLRQSAVTKNNLNASNAAECVYIRTKFFNNKQRGAYFYDNAANCMADVWLDSCVFSNNGISGTYQLESERSAGFHISNNQVYASYYGDFYLAKCGRTQFYGNHMDLQATNSVNGGVYTSLMLGSSSAQGGINVTGNTFILGNTGVAGATYSCIDSTAGAIASIRANTFTLSGTGYSSSTVYAINRSNGVPMTGEVADNYFYGWTTAQYGQGWIDGAPALTSYGAGTLSNPSIASRTDLTTGIYWPTANALAISAKGAPIAKFSAPSAPVNYLSISSGSTGVAPALIAVGETNTSLWLASSGTGNVRIATGGGEQIRISDTANAVNFLQLFGAATSNAPLLAANGSDTNIDLNLAPKGSGAINVRNGTVAQTLRVHNTYTDASNYERAKFAWESNILMIGTESAGTGATRRLAIGAGTNEGQLYHRSSNVWSFTNTSTGFPAIDIASGSGVRLGSTLVMGWNSNSYNDTGAMDTGLHRDSAGVVAVNNGTTGAYRDLKLRSLIATSDITVNGSAVMLTSTLSAATGASLVGYLQGGTGSVTQTLQAKLRQYVSVKDFGAVGDGVTDDLTAINNAITAVSTAGGGGVFFPGSSSAYMVSDAVAAKANVVLYAQPGTVVIKALASNTTNIKTFKAGNIANFACVGLIFDGNVANNTAQQPLTQVYNCQNWTFDRCIFRNSSWIGMNLSTTLTNVRITNNTFDTIGVTNGIGGVGSAQAMAFSGTGHDTVLIEGNSFTNVGLDSISVSNMKNLIVRGNTGSNIYTFLYCVSGQPVQYAVVANNVINGTIGMSQNFPTGGVKPPCNGIDLPSFLDAIIEGNVVQGYASAGIGIFSGSARLTVRGNRCVNNNQVPDGAGNDVVFQAGIVVRSYTGDANSPYNILIDGNVCTDNQATKTQRYGLLLSTVLGANVRVTPSNNFSGNRDGDIAQFDYPASNSAGTLNSTWSESYLSQNASGLNLTTLGNFQINGVNTATVSGAQTLTNKTLGTGTVMNAGTIDGVTIGATTAAAGTFTTVTAAGSVGGSSVLLSQLATPTGLAGVVSSTGGTVGVGTFWAVVQAYDANGNTTAKSAEVSVAVSTGSTNSITWSWTAVPGASSYRLIFTGNGAGQEYYYLTTTTNSVVQTANTSGQGMTLSSVNQTGSITVPGILTTAGIKLPNSMMDGVFITDGNNQYTISINNYAAADSSQRFQWNFPSFVTATGGLQTASTGYLGWSSTTASKDAADTKLWRDAANTLGMRNGTNAQTLRAYNTYTDASNYERAKLGWNANVLEIGAEAAGTGTLRALKLTGSQFNFNTAGGVQFAINSVNNAVNYLAVTGQATATDPTFAATGSDTNIGIWYATKGTGAHRFATAGGMQFRVLDVASAVNYLQALGSATTGAVTLSSSGTDTDVPIAIAPKGIGAVRIGNNALAVFQQATMVNTFQMTGTSTGVAPLLAAVGTDTNVDFRKRTQGTGSHVYETGSNGNVQLKVTHTASATANVTITGGTSASAQPSVGSSANGLGLLPANGHVLLNGGSPYFTFGYSGSNTYYVSGTAGGGFTASNWSSSTGSTASLQILKSLGGTVGTRAAVTSGTNIGAIQFAGDDGTNFIDTSKILAEVDSAVSTGIVPGRMRFLASDTAGTVTEVLRFNAQAITTSQPLTVATGSSLTNVQLKVTHTASAVNYLNITGAATGSGPTISAAGSDANIPLNISSKGYSGINFSKTRDATNTAQYVFSNVGGLSGDLNGGAFWRGLHIAGPALNISAANVFPRTGFAFETDSLTDPTVKNFYMALANTTAPFDFIITNNTGGNFKFSSRTSTGVQNSFEVVPGASHVNWLQVTGNTTGNAPGMAVVGTDSNVGMNLSSKGTGGITLSTNGYAQPQLQIAHTASAVNYWQLTGGAIGTAVKLSAIGSDANIDINLVTKGTGVLKVNGTAVPMTQGTGDVVGPASAVNNNVVFFNGTTGKLVKDSGLTLSGVNTGDQNIFASFPVAGQTTLTASSTSTALTFVAGSNITLTTDNTAKTLTIASTASGGGATVSDTAPASPINGATWFDLTSGLYYVYVNDGVGAAQWVDVGSGGGGTTASGGGAGTPGGTDTQVQFNDGGVFAGNAGFVFNKTTGALTVSGAITGSNLSGSNTGDETTSTIKTKLGITTLSGSNTGDQDLSGLLAKASNLSDLTNATTARTNLGLGSMATQAASGVAITGGTLAGLTTLAIRNAGVGAFDTTIAHNGTLTAARALTLNLNDADRTVSLSGNLTVSAGGATIGGTSSGTNTGDQNVFSSIAVSGQTTVASASTSGTLTLVAGTNVTLATDNTAKSITINAAGGGGTPGGSSGQLQYNNAGAFAGANLWQGTNLVEQRSGVSAQASLVYNTYTDAANYERAAISWSTTTNTLTIGAQAAGTGTLRAVAFVGASFTMSGTLTMGNLQLSSAAIQLGDWNGPIGWNTTKLYMADTGTGQGMYMRNGTNAQALYVANTHTDTSNYERAKVGWNAGVLEIGADAAGTGTLRAVKLLGSTVSVGTDVITTNTAAQTLSNKILTTVAVGASDTALARNAAGVVEINTGTAGSFGDLKLGTLYSSGTVRTQSSFFAGTDSSGAGQSISVSSATAGLADGLTIRANFSYGWGSSSVGYHGTVDTALMRNAAGIVEVNNGTVGVFADIKVKRVLAMGYNYAYMSGGAATGNPVTLTADGSDTNVDFNIVTKGTGVLKVNGVAVGGGGATPGGSSGQLQYNNAGALAGANLWQGTNQVEHRNGANAQSLLVYNTYTDASNYERSVMSWAASANVLTLGAQASGTGTLRNVNIVGAAVQVNADTITTNTAAQTLTNKTLTAPQINGGTTGVASITAGTNVQGQGQLSGDINIITTAANNPSGVTLPTATAGTFVTVLNKGANPVNIYPASGSSIDGMPANTSIQLPPGDQMELKAYSGGWMSSASLRAQMQPKTINITNPSNSEKQVLFFTSHPIVVSKITAVLPGATTTPSVTYSINYGADVSLAGTAVVTAGSTVTSVTTGNSVTAFNSPLIPANSWVWLTTSAGAGVVPLLVVSVEF